MISTKCQWCHDNDFFPCDDAISVCPFVEEFDELIQDARKDITNNTEC